MIFDKVKNYNDIRKGYSEEIIQSILSCSDDHPSILDIAGGTGQLAFLLEPYCSSVSVVDLSEESVALGKSTAIARESNVNFKVGSALDYLTESKKDIITCSQSYMYYGGKEFLDICHENLKSSGALCLIWKYPLLPKWIEAFCLKSGFERSVKSRGATCKRISLMVNIDEVTAAGFELMSCEEIVSRYSFSIHELACELLWSSGYDGSRNTSGEAYEILTSFIREKVKSLVDIPFLHVIYRFRRLHK